MLSFAASSGKPAVSIAPQQVGRQTFDSADQKGIASFEKAGGRDPSHHSTKRHVKIVGATSVVAANSPSQSLRKSDEPAGRSDRSPFEERHTDRTDRFDRPQRHSVLLQVSVIRHDRATLAIRFARESAVPDGRSTRCPPADTENHWRRRGCWPWPRIRAADLSQRASPRTESAPATDAPESQPGRYPRSQCVRGSECGRSSDSRCSPRRRQRRPKRSAHATAAAPARNDCTSPARFIPNSAVNQPP